MSNAIMASSKMLGSLTSNYNGGSVKNFTTIKDTQAHVALALQTWNLSLQKTDLGTEGGVEEKKKSNQKKRATCKIYSLFDMQLINPYIDDQIAFWRNVKFRGEYPPFAPKLKRYCLEEVLHISQGPAWLKYKFHHLRHFSQSNTV